MQQRVRKPTASLVSVAGRDGFWKMQTQPLRSSPAGWLSDGAFVVGIQSPSLLVVPAQPPLRTMVLPGHVATTLVALLPSVVRAMDWVHWTLAREA
jgi:hypothetical protein